MLNADGLHSNSDAFIWNADDGYDLQMRICATILTGQSWIRAALTTATKGHGFGTYHYFWELMHAPVFGSSRVGW